MPFQHESGPSNLSVIVATARQNIISGMGWSVIGVPNGLGELPFAYTVGLEQRCAHPEILCTGLPGDVSHALLNRAGALVSGGAVFSEGEVRSDLLDDFRCAFRAISPHTVTSHMRIAVAVADGRPVTALQLVWSDEAERLPWERGYNPLFRAAQPLMYPSGSDPARQYRGA